MPLWNNIGELMDLYIPAPPSVFWIDITRCCNLRCVMCPQSTVLQNRRSMSLDRFRRIVDDIAGHKPVLKLYLSGEPLLHRDLFEMIAYATAAGCETMIHTNATLLTAEMTDRLLASDLTFLSFSFDGCTPEIYEALRPPAKYDDVEANIRGFLERRAQRAESGPQTAIEIIRMQETVGLIEDFVKRWRVSGIDEVRVVEYMTWLNTVPDRRVGHSPDNGGYKPCAAPFQHGCILADGTVVPCCMDVNGQMPLGHLDDRTFTEIWSGNVCRRLRLAMLAGDLPPESNCFGCYNTFRELERPCPAYHGLTIPEPADR
jgi:MoaA/NifB/PqqE/SkfB family radical SAM enzyme